MVKGVLPAEQMRRGFLYYLERERAHPYRMFLHANNGEDIGGPYWDIRARGEHPDPVGAQAFRERQESVWLDRIHQFGEALVNKRGVTIDCFAHDFEWDDEPKVWVFHDGYPHGFDNALQAVRQYNADLGLWISPWGGYPCRSYRVKGGLEVGMERNERGLTLSGKRYRARFSTVCRNMIRLYDIGYFKFDGIGRSYDVDGAGEYVSDVEALLEIITQVRQQKPDIFINPSAGTWPSPFWLRWSDSTWRNGLDAEMIGKGSDRQQWLTYRDDEIYHKVVKRARFYPLNALMTHGIMIHNRRGFTTFDEKDIVDEIRSYFALGTNLQELYINPELMTSKMWDALAEAAIWARSNQDVLVDTHWVVGDPGKLEPYAWASWSPRKGIVMLRNPDDKPQTIKLSLDQMFELPEGVHGTYVLHSPWGDLKDVDALELSAGNEHVFELNPFEIQIYEAKPAT